MVGYASSVQPPDSVYWLITNHAADWMLSRWMSRLPTLKDGTTRWKRRGEAHSLPHTARPVFGFDLDCLVVVAHARASGLGQCGDSECVRNLIGNSMLASLVSGRPHSLFFFLLFRVVCVSGRFSQDQNQQTEYIEMGQSV